MNKVHHYLRKLQSISYGMMALGQRTRLLLSTALLTLPLMSPYMSIFISCSLVSSISPSNTLSGKGGLENTAKWKANVKKQI